MAIVVLRNNRVQPQEDGGRMGGDVLLWRFHGRGGGIFCLPGLDVDFGFWQTGRVLLCWSISMLVFFFQGERIGGCVFHLESLVNVQYLFFRLFFYKKQFANKVLFISFAIWSW